tara:strand:- start:1176 stop:2993 length:1818 start_codon:yes stop_codon:yes gene_type:complete
MMIFLLYFLSVIIIVLGFGLTIKKFLIKENFIESLGIGETGILGYYFLLLISLFFHFFISLNNYFVVCVYLLGFILFFLFRNYLEFFCQKRTYALIIFLIIPGLISIKGHPDLNWYYLPYMNYLKDFKIVFGVANFIDYLGFSQTWIDILATLRFPTLGAKGSNVIAAVFAIFFLFSIFELLTKEKNSSLKIFSYFIIILFISKFDKINEFGGHVPPILIGVLINIYFFKLIIQKNLNEKEIVFKILLYFSFVLLLRINYIFIFPIIFFILIKYNSLIIQFVINKKIIFLVFFIPILYFSKNFIHTGCITYPVSSTCFSKDNIFWGVGKDYAKLRSDGVQAGVRGWNQHVIIDGKIDDRIDYLIPLKENKILTHSEYINKKNFFWVKYWIQSGDIIKIINGFLIILFCSLSIYLVNFISNYKNNNYNKKNHIIIISLFIFQLILWFLLTPQTIYGGDVATVVFFVALSCFVLKNISIDEKKNHLTLVFLFFISISYFEYKNVNRIYDEYFLDDNNQQHFPWIKIEKNILDKDYFTTSINNFDINVKKKTEGRKLGLPDECANISMMCLPIERLKCIKDIYFNKKYLFIEGNEKQCLEHLKFRAFY